MAVLRCLLTFGQMTMNDRDQRTGPPATSAQAAAAIPPTADCWRRLHRAFRRNRHRLRQELPRPLRSRTSCTRPRPCWPVSCQAWTSERVRPGKNSNKNIFFPFFRTGIKFFYYLFYNVFQPQRAYCSLAFRSGRWFG